MTTNRFFAAILPLFATACFYAPPPVVQHEPQGEPTASESITHAEQAVDTADTANTTVDVADSTVAAEAALSAEPAPAEAEKPQQDLPKETAVDPRDAKKTLSFALVGDLMIGLNWPDESPELPPEDGAKILEPLGDELRAADIAVGNLEGVLLDVGGTPKKCSNPKLCYAFRSPERYAQHYADAGFDLLSVANNHTGDFGPEGRAATRRALDGVGIGYAGHENDAETAVIERDGIRYGFTAFSINTGTLRVQNEEKAAQLIADLRTRSDIVIVSMHIGAEGKQYNRITRQTEQFVGENRGNPWRFARLAIDAGADLVVGHGPHVLRAIDLYKGKFIAYSLGNFATTTSVNISGVSGYAPVITVVTDREGNFAEGKITSAIQQGAPGARRPIPDPTGACIREIKRLTEEDIPEAELVVENDGTIRLKGTP